MCEFYKITYWLSINAKRFNSTDFAKENDWIMESDGIGGFREYTHSQAVASITLNCTKFWLYGFNDDSLEEFVIQYNNLTVTVNQFSSERKVGILLYESPELDHFYVNLTLSSNSTMMIYCLYYEEPPIPISVGIHQMNYSNILACWFYTKDMTFDPNTHLLDPQSYGREYEDLNSPNAYMCGIK